MIYTNKMNLNLIISLFFLATKQCFSSLTQATVDLTFNSGGTPGYYIDSKANIYSAAALQTDGKIVTVGQTGARNSLYGYIARYNPDGTLDLTFNATGTPGYLIDMHTTTYTSVAIQADEKIIIVGEAQGGPGGGYIARYLSTDELDPSFNPNRAGGTPNIAGIYNDTNSNIYRAIAIQPNGTIIVVGKSLNENMKNYGYIARYLSGGTLDPSFNPNGFGGIPIVAGAYIDTNSYQYLCITLQPDGNIIVGGQVENNSHYYGYIARYLPSGTLDPHFGNAGASVDTSSHQYLAVAIQTNGSIIATGSDSTFTYGYITRYLNTGTIDTTFNQNGAGGSPNLPGSYVDTNSGSYTSFIIETNGSLIPVGTTRYNNSTTYGYMAQYTTNGTPNTQFNEGSFFIINETSYDYAHIITQSNQQLIVVGGAIEGGGYITRYFGSFASTPGGFIQYYPTTSFGFLGGGNS